MYLNSTEYQSTRDEGLYEVVVRKAGRGRRRSSRRNGKRKTAYQETVARPKRCLNKALKTCCELSVNVVVSAWEEQCIMRYAYQAWGDPHINHSEEKCIMRCAYQAYGGIMHHERRTSHNATTPAAERHTILFHFLSANLCCCMWSNRRAKSTYNNKLRK